MVEIAKLLTSVTKGATVPSEHVDMMWSTLVTGIVVVFLILVLLVFILWLLGKVLNIDFKAKAARKKAEPAPVRANASAGSHISAPVNSPAKAESESEEDYDGDDEEIIAVIAAAVAAYGEADGKTYRIASVRRKEKALRGNWNAAGVHENTRPF